MNEIKISKLNLRKFKKIRDSFKIPAKRAKAGWKKWDNNDVWMQIVRHILQIGNSKSLDLFDNSRSLKDSVRYVRLVRMRSKRKQRAAIRKLMKSTGARIHNKKTQALVDNLAWLQQEFGERPTKFMAHLSRMSEWQRIGFLKTHLSQFGEKTAREFLMTAGLANNAIAFDRRILRIFEEAGVEMPATACKKRRIIPSLYKEVQEQVLEKICKPLKLTGRQFDRMLYLNYDSIIDLIGPQN